MFKPKAEKKVPEVEKEEMIIEEEIEGLNLDKKVQAQHRKKDQER